MICSCLCHNPYIQWGILWNSPFFSRQYFYGSMECSENLPLPHSPFLITFEETQQWKTLNIWCNHVAAGIRIQFEVYFGVVQLSLAIKTLHTKTMDKIEVSNTFSHMHPKGSNKSDCGKHPRRFRFAKIWQWPMCRSTAWPHEERQGVVGCRLTISQWSWTYVWQSSCSQEDTQYIKCLWCFQNLQIQRPEDIGALDSPVWAQGFWG